MGKNRTDEESPVQGIGKTLKAVRNERDFSLDQVSEMTGVSKTMLGQIERGESVPSISTLWKVAKGLQLSLSTLLNNPEPEYKAVDILKDIQPVYDEEDCMVLYNIFPFDPLSGFEYFYILLQPGTVHASEPHRNAAQEYVVVTSGTLTLKLEDQEFILKAPAKINFHANIHHTYKNETGEPVIFQDIMKY